TLAADVRPVRAHAIPGDRSPRLAPPRRDREGRPARPPSPDSVRGGRATGGGGTGGSAAALPRAPSQIGPLCRFRRLFVLAGGRRPRTSERRVRQGRVLFRGRAAS